MRANQPRAYGPFGPGPRAYGPIGPDLRPIQLTPDGRGCGTRTHGLTHPKRARYQLRQSPTIRCQSLLIALLNSLYPLWVLKYFSLRKASIWLAKLSLYTRRKGRLFLVEGTLPASCCSKRRGISLVQPMYRFPSFTLKRT